MSDKTKIEWTDATWNPITGCSVVSPGCTHCYAMKLAGTRLQNHPSRTGLTVDTKNGPVWNGNVTFNEPWLDQPLRWSMPRMIFVCAHGDLFHESVPNEWIDNVFAVMALAKQHVFQVLTKRPERMLEYCKTLGKHHEIDRISLAAKKINSKAGFHYVLGSNGWHLPNVHLGVSVENQDAADKRIPILLDTPAAVRWISAEPLLEAINLERPMPGPDLDDGHGQKICRPWYIQSGIDWVVVGGESGPNARPMNPEWARSLRDQCFSAGVPFLFKQWGEYAPVHELRCGEDGIKGKPWVNFDPDNSVCRIGKKNAGRLLDGVEHNGYPT